MEPLPCLFCGESGCYAEIYNTSSDGFIVGVCCDNCGAAGPSEIAENQQLAFKRAIGRWNAAMEPPPIDAKIVDVPTLGRAESAALLNVTIRTIYNYERAGLITPVEVVSTNGARRRKYRVSDVERLHGTTRAFRVNAPKEEG